MKSIKIFALILIFTIVSSISIYAGSLGTIYSWYSSSDDIGMWVVNPNIYKEPLNQTSAPSYCESIANNAISEWNGVNGLYLSKTTTKSSAEIILHVGTLSEIQTIYSSFSSSSAGLCVYADDDYYGDYTLSVNGTTEDKYALTFDSSDDADLYVKEDGRTFSELKMVGTHEIGHAIGHYGHNQNSSKVMYPTVSSVYTVSSQEEDHMEIIY